MLSALGSLVVFMWQLFRCLSAGLTKGLEGLVFVGQQIHFPCTLNLLMSAAPCLINSDDIMQSTGNAVYSNGYIMEICWS